MPAPGACSDRAEGNRVFGRATVSSGNSACGTCARPVWRLELTERDAGMLLLHLRPAPRCAGRAGYWLLVVLVVLVAVAVARRRLGPSSSATTLTVEPALPSSAVQVRCWSRPTTTRLPPLVANPTSSGPPEAAPNRSALKVF